MHVKTLKGTELSICSEINSNRFETVLSEKLNNFLIRVRAMPQLSYLLFIMQLWRSTRENSKHELKTFSSRFDTKTEYSAHLRVRQRQLISKLFVEW